MKKPVWEGAPGSMALGEVGQLRVGLTRWNHLAGHEWYYLKKYLKVSAYCSNRQGRVKWIAIFPLRRFKVGRRSLYFRMTWGYVRH